VIDLSLVKALQKYEEQQAEERELERLVEAPQQQEKTELPSSYSFDTTISYYRDPECTEKLNYVGEGEAPVEIGAKESTSIAYVRNEGDYPYRIETLTHDSTDAEVFIESPNLDVNVPVKLTVKWNLLNLDPKDPLKPLKGNVRMRGHYFAKGD